MLSPWDSTVTYGFYNDGASYVRFGYSNGYAHRAVHVKATGRVPQGSQATEGTRCALSDGRTGSFGAGTSTGEHIHFHGEHPDGHRIPWDQVPAPYQTAGGGARPIETEGLLMALSEIQQRQMYEALVVGGQSSGAYYTPEAIINVIRGEIAPAIAAIAAGGIMYPGAGYLAFPALANAIREDDDVDEAEIAGRLAPVLAPLIAQNVTTLSDDVLARIADASADEIARRLAAG
ncbi:hypothetical protein [Microbacterium schleiferi]|uniref:Peptidase M23 domain-containing protein n=1 Tax=Microbacterium schleiferi TaxID=69362 RepID=A0ABU7V9Z3_9MICO